MLFCASVMIASPIISLLGSLQLLLEGQLPDTIRYPCIMSGAVAKDVGAACFLSGYVLWALHCGSAMPCMMMVYWEERWAQDLGELIG